MERGSCHDADAFFLLQQRTSVLLLSFASRLIHVRMPGKEERGASPLEPTCCGARENAVSTVNYVAITVTQAHGNLESKCGWNVYTTWLTFDPSTK